MTTDPTKRSTEHPIDRPPDTDPQQGHEHPEADPPVRLGGGGPDGKHAASSEERDDGSGSQLAPPAKTTPDLK